MFVYIWKDAAGVPFYVGFTKRMGRANPKNNGNRNWLTKQKLDEIGVDFVSIEIRHVATVEQGQELERNLIASIGRIQLGNGPLTNLREGGEGVLPPSPEHRAKLSIALRDPSHPIRSPEARAKQKERMSDPAVRALFSGDNNPAKKPESREKIKSKWQDADFRAMMIAERTGKPKNFSEEDRARRAEAVKNNPDMKSWADRNGKDSEFDAKRIAGIRAAQDKRREKMSDPEALARRKAKLKATMASPEYLAKRKQFDTPEYRAKLSAAKKAYWEKRKAGV